MAPTFEFDDGHPMYVSGAVIVNTAGGDHDANNDTDVFLPGGTPSRAVEAITEASDQLRSVVLKEGEPSTNLMVNGVEQPSVTIPLGHDVVVHS